MATARVHHGAVSMTKAIFTTKITPSYDDRPEERYHFPGTYLNQVRSAIGDHIIYYEPRRSTVEDSSRGGRQSYFATARVDGVIDDAERPNHYYALISEYLDFDRPVPFVEGNEYYEGALQKADGTTNKGAFGRAVRNLSDPEFDRILKAGFVAEIGPYSSLAGDGVAGGFDEPGHEFERPIVQLTISRPFRDRAFKRAVRAAYKNQCALTGLRLINGGGNPEVAAAHIKPVAQSGPDSIRNGIALSGTFHWLFDRGLISIADNFDILVAKKKIPDQVVGLLNKDGKIILPKDPSLRPHPHYLEFHRGCIFKG
jgi:putative restriction endonuclease